MLKFVIYNIWNLFLTLSVETSGVLYQRDWKIKKLN